VDLSIVRQARETLAGALAASQEAGDSPAAEALAGQIAQAVGALFSLEKEGGGGKQATRVAKALAALTEIAEALPRTGLPSAVRRKIEDATGRTRQLLEGAIRSDRAPGSRQAQPVPAKRRSEPAVPIPPPPAPRQAPQSPPTPAPRARLSSAPPAVRMAGTEAVIETDVGFMTETNFFVGFAGDLSDGGLFVSTWQTLPVGSPVTVVFTLPDGHQARAQGQVMWVREADETVPDAAPGLGVTLEGLTERDMKSVGSFMAKRAPIFHPG